MDYLDLPIDDENGVILTREGHNVLTNVPSLVVHHSPTGFEWGYQGSGPADLALNIIEAVLIQMGHDGPKTKIAWNNAPCFLASFSLHQKFKRRFIATMPTQGGTIKLSDIKNWINAHLPELV